MEHIPSEFRTYWRKLNEPNIIRLRSVIRKLFGVDVAPSAERVLQLAHGHYDADPVAEAFVDDAYIRGDPVTGRAMLDQAIAHGIESVDNPPDSLRRLFAEYEHDPYWVDHDVVQRGAFLFRRYGPSAFSFNGASTLLAYTESCIARPLSMTGRYAGDAALNRFMETSRFWIDTTEPGGLAPGAPGRATAMRVRVMHVFIRQAVSEHPGWDSAAWGRPISQSDSLVTLMAGSFATGVAMHALGYRSTGADIRAMMHFWRYVGYLMGVQPRWYPTTLTEAAQVLTTFLLKSSHTAGGHGVELIESYPRAFAPAPNLPLRKRIRAEVNYRVQLGYTRFFLPGFFYRRYDMPNPWPWALLPLLQIPGNLTVDLLAHRIPSVARLQDRYARWRRNTWFHNEMGEKKAEFKAAEQLRHQAR